MEVPKKLWVGAVIVLVLLGLGIWLGTYLGGAQSGGDSKYSAVYMTTGDIYFGELSWFPTPHITNAWFLQRGTDAQNRPQVGVAPMTSVFWGPSNILNLNAKDIIFWTKIKADSQLAKAMDNPQLVQGQNPAGNGPAGAVSTSSPVGR